MRYIEPGQVISVTTRLGIDVVALLALLASSGCGHGSTAGGTSAVRSSVAGHASTPATQADPSISATANPADYVDGTHGSWDPKYPDDRVITFASPAGKFYCVMVQTPGKDNVDCDATMPPNAPMISDCAGEQRRPNTIKVGTGEVASLGHGCSPVAGPDAKILPYNVILRLDAMRCVVRERTGLNCELGDGHGFTISDTAYELH